MTTSNGVNVERCMFSPCEPTRASSSRCSRGQRSRYPIQQRQEQRVSRVTTRVAPSVLGHVAAQPPRRNVVVRPVDRTLELRPEAFDGVGVDRPAHVFGAAGSVAILFRSHSLETSSLMNRLIMGLPSNRLAVHSRESSTLGESSAWSLMPVDTDWAEKGHVGAAFFEVPLCLALPVQAASRYLYDSSLYSFTHPLLWTGRRPFHRRGCGRRALAAAPASQAPCSRPVPVPAPRATPARSSARTASARTSVGPIASSILTGQRRAPSYSSTVFIRRISLPGWTT